MTYMDKVNDLRAELVEDVECLLTGKTSVSFDEEETIYKDLREEDGEFSEGMLTKITNYDDNLVLTFKVGGSTRHAYIYSLTIEELAELAELLQLYVG